MFQRRGKIKQSLFHRNMKKNYFNKQKGFTLVETLLVAAILIFIVGVLTLFSRNIWFYNTFISGSLESINEGRAALKIMTAEIRTASSGNNGSYAISAASSTSFTFYSDIDDDGLKERVRYFLNGTRLQKGVLKPTGSPLGYTGTESVTTLVSNVTNASLFNYYDENYEGTTAALSSPINVGAVRLVKITITIDKDINKDPAPATLSTQISMRNIKDNL